MLSMVCRWRLACHCGDRRRAIAFGESLARVVDEDIVIVAAISEPNQHLTDPAVSAARNGAGWVLNERKVFCTMSPAATLLLVSTHYQDSTGDALYGYAEVPANAPGVTVRDD